MALSAAQDQDRAAAVSAPGQRLDKWLWFARVVKSRTQAAGLVSTGKVRVNRIKIDKPAHGLKLGDVVTVSVGRKVRVLKVVAAGVRRGPASEAQGLFEELNPAPSPQIAGGTKASSREAAILATKPADREPGAGRPTKRDRRLIDQLRGRS
jgi:ribosome-associated heat shock protein Hsp15